MALYSNGFANNLADLVNKTPYFMKLGINMAHIMPILKCPIGKSDDDGKSDDNRWLHRPKINWERAELRKKQGTIEFTIFNTLKKLIAIRKETAAFADFNNREIIDVENEHLLCFERFDHLRPSEKVLVIANFDSNPQYLDLERVRTRGITLHGQKIDLYSGKRPAEFENRIVLSPYQFYWLTGT